MIQMLALLVPPLALAIVDRPVAGLALTLFWIGSLAAFGPLAHGLAVGWALTALNGMPLRQYA